MVMAGHYVLLQGKHIQYVLGDAAKLTVILQMNSGWIVFKKINVVPNEANGYGQRNITLYRRHYLQLEEGYVVIYDELEAEKPVKWTTQFQVPYYTIESKETANSKQQNFTVKTDVGLVNTSVFANTDLKMQVHDKFAEAAVNWNKVTDINMRYDLADITSKLYKKFQEGEERPLIECYGYVLEMPEKEILFDFGKGGARKKEPFRGVVFIKDFRQLDIAYKAQQNKGKNFNEVEFFKRSGEILSHLFIREYNKREIY